MKVVLLSLLVFPLFLTDRLDEDRKSCGKPKIAYIANDDSWTTKPIILDNPGLNPTDWDSLVRHECEGKRLVLAIKSPNRIDNDVDDNLSAREESERLEKLLKEHLEHSWENKNFRLKFAIDSPKVKSESVSLELLEWLLLLKSPSFSIGCREDRVTAKIDIPSFDVFNVEQCGDIGEDLDDAYSFYNVSTAWTYESNKLTVRIDEELCQQTNTTLMCPENATKLMVCSLNTLQYCKPETVTNDPESPSTSYVRLLPGGVAVYGTFERQLDLYEDKIPAPGKIEPGLYYFRYA